MKVLEKEIRKRRTFGIVSHPDAGKTTLTEKLLLFGGAIHQAGAVKSNKIRKGATSDFMEIERQRGISVATSVLAFHYKDKKINILDTPGHKDFAEDTYRTLTAVDSVIVVIDGAKGVEEQTKKLVEVCRMRSVPMIVFINKMDRNALDPFDLFDQLEDQLKLNPTPITFPIGDGLDFKGIYHILKDNMLLYSSNDKQHLPIYHSIDIADSKQVTEAIGVPSFEQLKENIEVVDELYPKFDIRKYLDGKIHPIIFGSALKNFGVQELLDILVEIAPHPKPQISENREVRPNENNFSGFVFKIHANMDPKHRDRLAFLKIVSGTFVRNTPYYHVRLNKKLKFSSPNAFFAEKRQVVETSYPGDIVGLHDTGNFKIGDTLTDGEKLIFKGIPSFSPEHFRYVINKNPLKTKQLKKGIDQLMDEGVAQLFRLQINGRQIIGTVGILQFEVIQYRLLHEYGAECSYEALPVYKACWIDQNNQHKEFDEFLRLKQKFLAIDKSEQLVFLADSKFTLSHTLQKFPSIKFHFQSEFNAN
ncbi:MAG: peptide chain release factor 3 [Flavobacteriaceae bacterium]|nr:peptide chain release factor 3 [Flavobacteriaceae bacterium]MCY4216269.1 peptide chain release factor 3 [Flavobacteriaceae bacterium]MCY4253116.1 peptide chain release factor 3 [Flavobacteriaceae bacterium]